VNCMRRIPDSAFVLQKKCRLQVINYTSTVSSE